MLRIYSDSLRKRSTLSGFRCRGFLPTCTKLRYWRLTCQHSLLVSWFRSDHLAGGEASHTMVVYATLGRDFPSLLCKPYASGAIRRKIERRFNNGHGDNGAWARGAATAPCVVRPCWCVLDDAGDVVDFLGLRFGGHAARHRTAATGCCRQLGKRHNGDCRGHRGLDARPAVPA